MFNPANASKKIKDEFIDYISTTFTFADIDYQKLFRNNLNNIISQGPIIDIKDIFKTGKSIGDLIHEFKLSKLFKEIELNKPQNEKYKIKLPISRPLYVHQEHAIDEITSKKHNVVITTGTGSGKTECFLIPILNELLTEIENGTLNNGVRALLIYPMNALANDQMKRLRQILMYYPKISFGVYNGDTEKKYKDALSKYIDLHKNEDCEELKKPLENEYICREQMQDTPPHILCTNYAMLEQMLLRPENDKIFTNSKFKFVVLDEAHIYSGATGMETSLLLRRLRARIESETKIQYILTSATLGEKGKSEEQIINFANNLCGSLFTPDNIIFGERELKNINIEAKCFDLEIFSEISKIENIEEETLINIFKKHNIMYDKGKSVNSNIYYLCLYSDFYKKIRKNINGPISVYNLKEILGTNVTIENIVEFIYVCTLAEDNGKSLIDARYHFFIRALEGAYIPLSKNKQLFLDRKKTYSSQGVDYKVFEIALCKYCGEFSIVGKINDIEEIKKLDFASQYDKEEIKYFKILEKNDYSYDEEDDIEEDELEEIDDEPSTNVNKNKKLKIYHLCPCCGAICEEDEGVTKCNCNIPNIAIAEIENNFGKCLSCNMGTYNRFYLGNEASTAVLATTLFEELPTKIVKDYDGDEWVERIGGKQFLAFSDSRSDAAFFASYMDKSYKEFLRRRGIVRLINENKNDMINCPMNINDAVDLLSKMFMRNQSFQEHLSYDKFSRALQKISLRNAWIAILNELISVRRPGSLSSLGYLKFQYAGNNDKVVSFMLKKNNRIDFKTMKELLDELAMSFAYFGAVGLDNDILEPEDRKYIFYTEKPKMMVKQKDSETNKYNGSWMARNRIKKENTFYKNSKQVLVSKVLDCSLKEANDFLEYYFDEVLLKNKEYSIERGNGNFYFMPVKNYILRVVGDKNVAWYKCKKCNRLTSININGICPKMKCGGQLEFIDIDDYYKDNHYISLYSKKDLTPLIIKEHTAQLSRAEGLEYQQDFEKNRINALSCSTTFEMGVDVGDLETVFLRNVPPSSANYAQRAGRAGRSKNSAAYALTYAKLSSHDFNYFNNPIQMINGTILPPLFKIDNKKIVLRHIFAVALSYYFKNYPNYFNNNNATIFLESDGYEKLKAMLNLHPEELKEIMIKSFGEQLNKEFNIENFGWVDELVGNNGVLKNLIDDYNKTILEFEDLKKQYLDKQDYSNTAKVDNRLKIYKNKRMIDFLARGNVLPKYGFPIDTVELEISNIDNYDAKKELQLTRDLKLAISEYAPGEKVVANNKMYTSRYIKHSIINGKYAFNESSICECENCHTWNYSESGKVDDKTCIACGKPLPKINWVIAIEPNSGFISDGNTEEVPMKKPDKLYRNDDSYIGNKKAIASYIYKVNNKNVLLKSTENDQILVTSKTAFFVCPLCGFTYGILDNIKDEQGKKDKEVMKQIAMGKICKFITPKKPHKKHFGGICNCNRLERKYLYHVFSTDVLIMEFEDASDDSDTMISVMYALLNGISHELNIERSDIDACLKYSINQNRICYNIVFYDAVAGGAGHVKRLLEDNGISLTKIFDYAFTKLNSCSCESSCYNCLRSYENQKFHDKLDRYKALSFLSKYRDKFIFEKIIENNDKSETINLSIVDKGLTVNDKSLSENLNYLFDPDDKDGDFTQLSNLLNVIEKKPLDSPDYYNATLRDNYGKRYKVDLLWDFEKVILLMPDKNDTYNKIKNSTQFNVFCLNQTFDIDEFIKSLRR